MQNGHKKRCGETFKTFLTATDSLELHEDKLKVPLSPGNQGDLESFLTPSASSITTEMIAISDWMFFSVIFHVKQSFIPT